MWKKTFCQLFPLVFIGMLACHSPENNQHLSKAVENNLKPDTLFVDLNEVNAKKEAWDLSFRPMSKEQWIDSLKQWAKPGEVRTFHDPAIFYGHFSTYGKYYEPNLPKSIYSTIFPKEEIEIDKQRIFKGDRVDNHGGVPRVIFGTEIRETRHYPFLFGVQEKENHLQLLFTKAGKYSPALDLITVEKHTFAILDQIEIFGGIVDAGDINYWISEFNNDFSSIKKKHIKNQEYWGKADTLVQHFTITNSGKIIKQ